MATVKVKMTTNARLVGDVLPSKRNTFYALKELINNSIKAAAKYIRIDFVPLGEENTLEYQKIHQIIISDDGEGLSSKVTNPNSIFEKGITTTNGSGLGLYNVAAFVNNVLKGTISVDNSQNKKGFKLTIKF